MDKHKEANIYMSKVLNEHERRLSDLSYELNILRKMAFKDESTAIKLAEKRGAERMITVLKCLKPFNIESPNAQPNICDHCMLAKEVWKEWELVGTKE